VKIEHLKRVGFRLTFTFYLLPFYFSFLSMDVLGEIIASKRVRLAEAKAARGLESLRAAAFEVRAKARPHALRRALEDEGRVNIIAEVKRASPSLGMIRVDAEPARIARRYEAGGAAAISVLTEEDRFRGSLDDLRAVRAAVGVPLLRKDFIFEEYQLYEAAGAGADALLLITAALDDETLTRLRRITEDELGMDALVEVHTKEEMARAVLCGAELIGVNNRDLRTFKVSLDTSVELINAAPPDALCISESGLRTPDDLRRLRSLGYRGFLIGETLMRADRPEETLRALL
jgi:indole-3-glycerol phosphate synthase